LPRQWFERLRGVRSVLDVAENRASTGVAAQATIMNHATTSVKMQPVITSQREAWSRAAGYAFSTMDD